MSTVHPGGDLIVIKKKGGDREEVRYGTTRQDSGEQRPSNDDVVSNRNMNNVSKLNTRSLSNEASTLIVDMHPGVD